MDRVTTDDEGGALGRTHRLADAARTSPDVRTVGDGPGSGSRRTRRSESLIDVREEGARSPHTWDLPGGPIAALALFPMNRTAPAEP